MNELPRPEFDEEMLRQINQLDEKINPNKKNQANRQNIEDAQDAENRAKLNASSNKINKINKIERSKNYAQNILFGLAYLYIHLQQAPRAEQYLRTLCLLDRKNKSARVLLAVSLVMQGKKVSAELFNQIRQTSSPALVMMLAKRLQR